MVTIEHELKVVSPTIPTRHQLTAEQLTEAIAREERRRQEMIVQKIYDDLMGDNGVGAEGD